jgi:uncharacterized membrane protein
MTQSRWRSPVAWAGIAAAIFMIVKSWVGFEIPDWDKIVTTLISALVAFGILNNPEKKDGF